MPENEAIVKGLFLYPNQIEAFEALPGEAVKQIVMGSFAYMNDKPVDIPDPLADAFFKVICPALDYHKKQQANGSNGGRPKTQKIPKNNPDETQPKTKHNPSETQPQPKANPDETQGEPNTKPNIILESRNINQERNTPPTPPQGEAVVVSSVGEPVSSVESTTTPTGKRRRKREADAPSEYSPLFEEFWEAYPRRRRVNKFAAWKKFWAAQQAGILPDDIVQRVRNRQCEEDWAKEDGQYVPAPEVWLNKHGWEDEGCVWDPMGYKKLPQEIQDLMEEHYQWSLKLKHGMWQPGESQEEFDERYEKWQRINLEYTERIQAMGVSSYEPLP